MDKGKREERAKTILARLLAMKHEEDVLRDELFELTYPAWKMREKD